MRVFRVDPQAKLIQLGDCCPWYSTRELHIVIWVASRYRVLSWTLTSRAGQGNKVNYYVVHYV